MIEFLKRSVAGLEAPFCEQCDIPMVWYRSALVQDEPNSIVHSFQCPTCNNIRELKTVNGDQ
jgi:hypothetical protein